MKWLEKNWVVVAIVLVAYLYFNGSLSGLLGGGTTATPGDSNETSSIVIMGG